MTVLSSEKEVHPAPGKADFLVQGGASRRLFHITAFCMKVGCTLGKFIPPQREQTLAAGIVDFMMRYDDRSP